mgnify:CR=1 FL=1
MITTTKAFVERADGKMVMIERSAIQIVSGACMVGDPTAFYEEDNKRVYIRPFGREDGMDNNWIEVEEPKDHCVIVTYSPKGTFKRIAGPFTREGALEYQKERTGTSGLLYTVEKFNND